MRSMLLLYLVASMTGDMSSQDARWTQKPRMYPWYLRTIFGGICKGARGSNESPRCTQNMCMPPHVWVPYLVLIVTRMFPRIIQYVAALHALSVSRRYTIIKLIKPQHTLCRWMCKYLVAVATRCSDKKEKRGLVNGLIYDPSSMVWARRKTQ